MFCHLHGIKCGGNKAEAYKDTVGIPYIPRRGRKHNSMNNSLVVVDFAELRPLSAHLILRFCVCCDRLRNLVP